MLPSSYVSSAGNYVVRILKHPLTRAKLPYPGTNQVVTVLFGTNRLGVFPLTPEQHATLDLGTNRFVAVRVEPATLGTNQVLAWRVESNPELAEQAQRLNIELINLSPASGFFVAFQVALYGGMVLASPVHLLLHRGLRISRPQDEGAEIRLSRAGLRPGPVLGRRGLLLFRADAGGAGRLAKYSQWLGFSAYQWKAEDYISFVCKFMLGMGLGFEMPVVILTLVKIGILNYGILSKGRKYMIVINLRPGCRSDHARGHHPDHHVPAAA